MIVLKLCRGSKRIGDKAEAGLPAFAKPDAHGNYPAVQYTRVSIAGDLIRQRKSLGLSQSQPAQLANVRQETSSGIENAKHAMSQRTFATPFRALGAAGKSRGR